MKKITSNELLTSIDVLNTLNGGTSEPILELKEFQDHREVRLSVPSLKEENLQTEIHNNILRVFYTQHIQSNQVWVEVPQVVYNKPIPYFVDADRITASFDNGLLTVTLPFNSLAQGYHRKISIES